MQSIEIIIPGKPIAQPRHRMNRAGGRAYVPSGHPVHAWRQEIAVRARMAINSTGWKLTGPMKLELRFVMPRPKCRGKGGECPHTSRPDADNLSKAAKDAVKGICWLDDSQVVNLWAEKVVAAYGAVPGLVMTITRLG